MGSVLCSPDRSAGVTWLPSQSWLDFKDSKVSMERQRRRDCSRALRMKTETGGATAQGLRPELPRDGVGPEMGSQVPRCAAEAAQSLGNLIWF